jgi:hypothetical protein
VTNESPEKGCLAVVAFIVIAAIGCYCDYYYKLAIVKEAIKQTQQESARAKGATDE